MCIVDSYDKSIYRRYHTGYGPGSKEDLVKMICSPASGVESFLGGISHPEMFCKSVGGNDNFRHTRFRKGNKFCILLSILCHVPGRRRSKINSKITLIILSEFIMRRRIYSDITFVTCEDPPV